MISLTWPGWINRSPFLVSTWNDGGFLPRSPLKTSREPRWNWPKWDVGCGIFFSLGVFISAHDLHLIGSMGYRYIFHYLSTFWLICLVNVGKDSVHGSYVYSLLHNPSSWMTGKVLFPPCTKFCREIRSEVTARHRSSSRYHPWYTTVVESAVTMREDKYKLFLRHSSHSHSFYE